MKAATCDRCGKTYSPEILEAVSIKLGTRKYLEHYLPSKWAAIPPSEKNFFCDSQHLSIDLCPECQKAVLFWLRTKGDLYE